MDLSRLKIERPTAARRASGRGRRFSRWITRGVVLLAVAGVLWFLRVPLLSWLDRLRLREVEAVAVVKRSAVAAGALSGAAANGYIVASTRAALSADTPGRITEINVREGQAVKKGFVVARLYDAEYKAALRRAEADVEVGRATIARFKADLESAEADVERLRAVRDAARAELVEASAEVKLARLLEGRVKGLVEDGAESREQLDEATARLEKAEAAESSAQADVAAADAALVQARSGVALAQAAVEEAVAQLRVLEAARDQAGATLDKTEVRAPFDGVVVLKDAEVGEVVSPNSQAGSNARGSVITMVDFDSLEVQAEVPETTIFQVQVGAPVRIFLDASPGTPYVGTVDRIWPTADRQKATIEVRAIFAAPDDRLRPEMGVRVVFLAPEDLEPPSDGSRPPEQAADEIVVPTSAVIDTEEGNAVFVLVRDTVALRSIVLGERRGERVAVRDGLVGDERVVVRPPASLRDGDRVRLKENP